MSQTSQGLTPLEISQKFKAALFHVIQIYKQIQKQMISYAVVE